MNQPDVFKDYARSYDTMYQDKDYKSECDFIEAVCDKFKLAPCNSILDLGSGTGGHAIPLAERGYTVHGVDLSPVMLARAQEKGEQSSAASRLSWSQGDLGLVRLSKQFDLVICMFAVMSYQVSNAQLKAAFHTVRTHLRPGGLFICDFWYGPAVLRDPPVTRERWIPAGAERISRKATPSIDFNSNSVQVSYELTTYRGEEALGVVRESHQMRYLFLPELELIGSLAQLKLVGSSDCCKIGQPPSEKTWTASTFFQG